MSSPSLSSGTRALLAISAQAKDVPCHVDSAIAGMSYKLAAAIEWIEKSWITLSRTCSEKSEGRRSEIRATALAAEYRTMVSCIEGYEVHG